MGFKHTEFAACNSGDPTKMSAQERKEIIKLNDDLVLYSLQVLLTEVEHMAYPDLAIRSKVLDYMRFVSRKSKRRKR
jgi:hypothetical protein